MPATAIDIGSHTIKALVGKSGANPVIDKYVSIPNPSGLSVPQDDLQFNKLLEIIDSLFHDHKLPKTDVRLSLPEKVVSTKVIQLPPLTDSELASAIDWQAEQNIPIPLNQLSLEYQVLYRPSKKQKDEAMKVLLVGTQKNVVNLTTDLFFELGIQPTILETQSFSLIRALGFDTQDPTTMIVHIGSSDTQVVIVDKTQIQLATNISGGGKLFTRSIQQAINNLTREQAEEYQKAYGVQPTHLEGKIRNIILPALNTIGQEVNKTLLFYNNQKPDSLVTRVVLTGGTSKMPGMIEYFAELTGKEILMASPFAPAKGKLPEEDQQSYIICMGLMIRDK